MISKNMEKLLNEQLNAELYSAYLYLSMSGYLEDAGYKGMAHWFFVQYKEETDHALFFYKYLLNEGAQVEFPAIPAPEMGFTSPINVLERTLAHEQKVTGMIHNLVAEATAEKDFRTVQFLQWFVSEQSEEEANCEDNLKRVKLAGKAGMYFADQEFAARMYAMTANPPIAIE